MIYGVFGLPGSGKSTLFAKIAKKALRRGENVYSNFYIKGTYKLKFSDLGKRDFHDCTILIDEISLFADTRAWKDFDDNLVYFFTTHCRHANCVVWWASQNWADSDKKIRNLTDTLYYIKRSFLPCISSMRTISKDFDVDGTIVDGYKLVGLPQLIFRPFYYKMFDSFTTRSLPPVLNVPWDSPTINKNSKKSPTKSGLYDKF